MSKVDDLKNALKQLEELGLPISLEQRKALKDAENEDFENNIIPAIKKSLGTLLADIDHKVKLVIDYDGKDGGNIEVRQIAASSHLPENNHPSYSLQRRAGGKTLRATFPDGHWIQDKGIVVLTKIVEKVGPELVHEMDIKVGGIPLVDTHRDTGIYKNNQKLLSNGYYLMTLSDAERKKKMIETISRNLGLGLKVDIIDSKGNIVSQAPSQRSDRKKLRITTPEGKVFFNNVVWETLRDVVLYAGADRVKSLGLENVGLPLIADHVTPGIYESAQHEIANGVYLNTSADTQRKMQQIQEISDRFGLNLKIELI